MTKKQISWVFGWLGMGIGIGLITLDLSASEPRMTVRQEGDSIVVTAVWPAATVDADQYPITSYRVRLMGNADTVAFAIFPVDTLSTEFRLLQPPLGTLLHLQALIASIDSAGTQSAWTFSNIIVWTTIVAPPSPPDSIVIDTSGALVLTGARMLDNNLKVVIGGEGWLAMLLYSGNVLVDCCCPDEAVPGNPPHPCDTVLIGNLRDYLPPGALAFRWKRGPDLAARIELASVADSGVMLVRGG